MHDYENEQNSGEGKETDEIDSSMTNHGINNNTLDNDLTYRQDKTTQENECANESRVDIETNIVLLAHKSKTEHTIELTGEKAGKENSKEDNSIKVDTRTEHHMNNNRNDNNQNNYHVETAADVIQVNNDQVNERISDNVSSNVEQNNANELHVDNNVCQIDKNEERNVLTDMLSLMSTANLTQGLSRKFIMKKWKCYACIKLKEKGQQFVSSGQRKVICHVMIDDKLFDHAL
ncbi:hypothetical protein MAR_005612, partial [Mya arenaria]